MTNPVIKYALRAAIKGWEDWIFEGIPNFDSCPLCRVLGVSKGDSEGCAKCPVGKPVHDSRCYGLGYGDTTKRNVQVFSWYTIPRLGVGGANGDIEFYLNLCMAYHMHFGGDD